MATLVVTNLDSAPLLIQDLYATIAVGGSLTTTQRGAGDLSGMSSLHQALVDGKASYTMTYSATELASGMVNTENSAPASAALAGHELIRVVVPAGSAGQEDVVVFAAGSLPYKMRIVDAWALIDTAQAGSWEIRDEAAGAGTVAATLDSTSTGRVVSTAPTASEVFTPGATKGLFIDQSDGQGAGEVFLLVRKEV